MLFRRLQQPGTGRPSLVTRVLAALVALGLLAITAPLILPILAMLIRAVTWVIDLL